MAGPLAIGTDAPDFEALTTEGSIRFHEWLGNSWGVLFSHPKDFTPVCTTELGYMARIKPEFDRRHVKVIGLSVDPLESHTRWSKDIEETQGHAPNYPMIADADLKVSKLYGMLPATAGDTANGRTAMDNQTVRNVYVIGPDKKVKLVISYPMSTGRNFDEVLRVIDSMQLTAQHRVATPANWRDGDKVIILPAVTDAEAKEKYPDGWARRNRTCAMCRSRGGPVEPGEGDYTTVQRGTGARNRNRGQRGGHTIYTTAMTFDISGRSVRWPDGSDGTIQQEGFDREGSGSRHAYVVRFRVERTGAPHITGGLRFTAAAHERMPGRNDEEKAEALALKIVSWVAQHGLTDGFFFRVDANDSGIEVLEA